MARRPWAALSAHAVVLNIDGGPAPSPTPNRRRGRRGLRRVAAADRRGRLAALKQRADRRSVSWELHANGASPIGKRQHAEQPLHGCACFVDGGYATKHYVLRRRRTARTRLASSMLIGGGVARLRLGRGDVVRRSMCV